MKKIVLVFLTVFMLCMNGSSIFAATDSEVEPLTTYVQCPICDATVTVKVTTETLDEDFVYQDCEHGLSGQDKQHKFKKRNKYTYSCGCVDYGNIYYTYGNLICEGY